MDFSTLDPISIAVGVGIGLILAFLFSPKGASAGQINHDIQKNEPKVATMCPLKDIEDTVSKSDKGVVAFCRCWKSKKFPYCDVSVPSLLFRCLCDTPNTYTLCAS